MPFRERKPHTQETQVREVIGYIHEVDGQAFLTHAKAQALKALSKRVENNWPMADLHSTNLFVKIDHIEFKGKTFVPSNPSPVQAELLKNELISLLTKEQLYIDHAQDVLIVVGPSRSGMSANLYIVGRNNANSDFN